MKRNNGFTLIELLAVIVILAIIALIATPIVLDIINDTKKNAQKATVNNIIHAAELYYSKVQMTGKGLGQVTFDLKDENNGLEFDGERPNGTITIYNDGSVLLNSKFEDGSTYIKLPNEDTLDTEDKSIGSYENWEVDKDGKIKYLSKHDKSIIGAKNFLDYLFFAYEYGITDKTGSKSLQELIKEKEKSGELTNLYLTENLQKEVDIVINDMNVAGALTPSQIQSLVVGYQTTAPNVLDVFLNKDTHKEKYENYVAYQEIYNSLPKDLHESGYLVIPNQVKQKDGTLKKVTTIATDSFVRDTGDHIVNDLSTHEGEISTLKGGVNVVISEGITTIEDAGFHLCALNSISLPTTLEIIGENSFWFNKLDNIYLPSALKEIDDAAFAFAGIKGELLIPKSVQSIGSSAFQFTDEYNEYNNNITKLVFEEGSVIETIGIAAFAHNPITELTLPPSIKTIGKNAFYTENLKSVIIEKAEGDNLTIGTDAFGTATVEYRPRQD